MTVRYGIIGCGMMGQEHLRNLALLPGAEVVALYEPNAAMARAAAALAPGAELKPDLGALLQSDLDALVIASPNHLHLGQLEQIAKLRPLPVLVEKPLFTDPGDAARAEVFEASYPAPVWVAMEYRYMPPIAALIAEAEAATGGVQMLTIREHRFPFLPKVDHWNRFAASSGGTFVEKCCHFFDLMRLILGAEPVRLTASAGQAVNHLGESYDGAVPDMADHGYVMVDFDSGARAMLELCMFAEGARYQEEISALGPRGKIEALVPGPGRFWTPSRGAPPEPRLITSPRDGQGYEDRALPVDPALLEAGDHNGATFYQHQRFLELLEGKRPAPEVSLRDGRLAVLMGQAAEASAAKGETLQLSVDLA